MGQDTYSYTGFSYSTTFNSEFINILKNILQSNNGNIELYYFVKSTDEIISIFGNYDKSLLNQLCEFTYNSDDELKTKLNLLNLDDLYYKDIIVFVSAISNYARGISRRKISSMVYTEDNQSLEEIIESFKNAKMLLKSLNIPDDKIISGSIMHDSQ